MSARCIATATANMSWTRLLLTRFVSPPALRRKPRLAMSCPRYRWIFARFPAPAGEKRLLQRSLEQAKYHQKQAAELLG
ncbi:hypothetical protein LNQ03_32725 [Klebsiella pneumoniae subsp. pneumoniae]|nr:hypothetical protein [Klebsiella pneumoniae subsp. pneumoniae]